MPEIDPNRLHDPHEAAELLGVDKGTLSYWRQQNFGPPFLKLTDGRKGRIRYRRADLLKWISSRIKQPDGQLVNQAAARDARRRDLAAHSNHVTRIERDDVKEVPAV